MPEPSYNTVSFPFGMSFFVMRLTKNRLVQRLSSTTVLVLLLTACASPSNLPTDDNLLGQWQSDLATLQSLTQACGSDLQSYDIAERYQENYPLLPTTTIEKMEGCELPADLEKTAVPLQHLAKLPDNNAYLLVTHQYRKGTGWIEESVSRWTSGWISWKTAILEEKGFVYIAESEASVFELPLQNMSIDSESLDKFSGRYRITSQVSGNGCEIWRLRPAEDGWYLFYHQVRECAV